MLSLASGFIEATAANVSDPFDGFIVRVVELGLKHLQIAHLEAARRERHLKAHRYGRPCPFFLLVGHELDLGTQLRLFHAAHSLDLPHNRVLTCLILCLAFFLNKFYSIF